MKKNNRFRSWCEQFRGYFPLNARRRILLSGIALMAAAWALILRAEWLQLLDSKLYQEKSDKAALGMVKTLAVRGMLTDRNGEPLAVSSPKFYVTLDPSLWVQALQSEKTEERSKAERQLEQLAGAVGVPVDWLRQKILESKGRRGMRAHPKPFNPEQFDAVMALGIPWLGRERVFARFYPQGEVFAHVLGTANEDGSVLEGLERGFNDVLAGKPGLKRMIRDNNGRFVEYVELVRAAEPGKDVKLSLDRRIQYLAYRELKDAVERHNAAGGSAVVMDVRNGEVLAMVGVPAFNPNNLEGVATELRRNRVLTDPIEPGSTIKPLTVAAGLEAGVISVNSTFNTSPGWIANGGYRTTDTRNNGTLTTTGLIQKSSNVGMALIVRQLSNQQFYDFLHRMGFGQRTGVNFPGEVAGTLREPARWDGTSKQTMSYGYALNVTPMQIVHAYAMLGNDGVAVRPTLLKDEVVERRQVLDPEVARSVVRMMQTVTEPGGTATQAAILGYHVAGKTGTARKSVGKSGYSRRYVTFFAGLVPAKNPRYAMVVTVDDPDPSKGYYGGLVAAPVFRNVMEGTLRLMDVPPDDMESWIAAQQKASGLQASAAMPLPQPLERPL